jgi:hypothetical protein
MTNDTQNSLTDFDMCLALAQKAINRQMATAWESWIYRSEHSKTDEMKDFALVEIYDNDFNTSGIKVEFAPLTVSLYVPKGKLGQVQVTLHLKSGTVFSEKVSLNHSLRRDIDKAVEHMIAEAVEKGEISPEKSKEDSVFDQYTTEYKKQNPEKFREEYKINNWSISFLTDLDKKPCDRTLLKQIDPKGDEAVEKCIEAAKRTDELPDSVFSIEYLFMKFTEVDLLLSDNKNIHIPPDVPKAVADKAKSCLNTLLRGNNGEFILGTVVRRSKTRSEGYPIPTFGLTDFAFHVKADDRVPEASTLSYLGMFLQRHLPQGKALDFARIKLADNWVRPEMIDGTKSSVAGTMAISKNIFMNQYLIPKLSTALKNFDRPIEDIDGLYWEYVLNPGTLINGNSFQRKKDVVVREYQINREGKITISLEKGTCKLKIDGFAKGSVTYNSYFKIEGWEDLPTNPISGGLKAAWELGNGVINKLKGRDFHFDASIAIEGQQNFSGHINLLGTGGTLDFKVETTLEPPVIDEWISSPQILKNEVNGTATWSDHTWFGDNIATGLFKLFNINAGTTPNTLIEGLNHDVIESLKTTIKESLSRIEIDLKSQAFIPPGGGVFTFQNLRFSDAGDLLFDVIYQTPLMDKK